MCTRFVYRGSDIITGFNFDIDLSVWTHKVIKEKGRFYIGILRPDGIYHSYHGVNQNGNAGTLLYVHGNSAGAYQSGSNCMTIADLTEQFIKAQICNGVQREHNKKLNNGLPILHKVPPKRDYGRYFCIMAEKGGTSHGGLTEKLSPFFHAKKQEVNAYGR